jgi:hypothetical protein
MHLTVTRATALGVATLIGLLASAAVSHAQDGAADAMFITVPNPITSDAVTRIKNQINSRKHKLETIVFDFNPDGKPASTTDFGPCSDLADFIAGPLLGKKTIAFIHAPTTGHTLLPVLACKEVVMGKNGVLGPIVTEGVPSLKPYQQEAYSGLPQYKRVGDRPHDRWAIVQKMFDPGVKLVKGPKREGQGVVYADARDEKAVGQIAGNPIPVPNVQEGQLASYPAQVAREVELAKGQADTRKDVAELYGLPPPVIRDDPLQGRTPDAYQWTLKGDVDGTMRESVNRVIRDIRKKKGNVLILVMNCGGTDLDVARDLADDLIKAQSGDEAVQIIAFVPETAPDAAAVVALGCSEIVMTKPKPGNENELKEADFGNFERYTKTAKPAAIKAQIESSPRAGGKTRLPRHPHRGHARQEHGDCPRSRDGQRSEQDAADDQGRLRQRAEGEPGQVGV